MTPRSTDLLENQTTNITDPTPIQADGAVKAVAVWGNFGSGTVTLQGSPDNGTTWITLKKTDGSDATFTANAIEKINVLKNGLFLRATLSGATSPNVNAKVF